MEAFAAIDDAFTRHYPEVFIHLRRHTSGAFALRFHGPWPAPQPLRDELDRIADELSVTFTLVQIHDGPIVVQVDPLPELDDLLG